jgi:hypothetical protein
VLVEGEEGLPTRIEIKDFEDDITNKFHTIEKVRDDIRWERLADRNPPGIKLIRRGKEKEYVATISKTGTYAGLYASWEPILAELERKKVTNGGRRIKHDEIGNGVNPELVVGTDSVFAAGGSGSREERTGTGGILPTPITNTDMET